MGFFDKILGGADLRRAEEAEAGGDYLEAARAYAAAGERHKVAEMHLLASERTGGQDGKLDALREAARWADTDDERGRRVRRRVAASLLGWVKTRGIITEGDRAVVAEAAALFVSAGDATGAGQCHELLGSAEAAAAAYQSAGEVERLEQLLDGEAVRRRRAIAVRDALEEHRFRLRGGDPANALRALEAALAAAEPKDRAELLRAREELLARRLPERRLVLVRSDGPVTVVAPPPLVLGRGADAVLSLRDGGISRHHLELRWAEGDWQVADLGSKNGTTLGGVPLRDARSLPDAGELGVGELCGIACARLGPQLALEVVRGLDRGARVLSGHELVHIAERTGGEPLLCARFTSDGRVRVRQVGRALFVNGISAAEEIEPLRGDVLEVGTARWDVSA